MKSFLLLPIVFVYLLFPQMASSQNQPLEAAAPDSVKVKILFRGQGKVILNVYDDQFRHSGLQFGNPTNNDTVVSKIIAATNPVHFWYLTGEYDPVLKKVVTHQRNFVVLPGDSIELEKATDLTVTKYTRFNDFIDSIYGVNRDGTASFKTISVSKSTDSQIAAFLKDIDQDYLAASNRIAALYNSKAIDAPYKAMLDTFNLLVKYYKISGIKFDEKSSVEKVKLHFEEPVNYIKYNLKNLLSINSIFSFSILNLASRYDARLAGRPLEKFWDYFNAVEEPLKSSLAYRNYVLSRLQAEESFRTDEQYRQVIAKAKQSGIHDARFDSVLEERHKAKRIAKIKGNGMYTTSGELVDYATMISSLKGKYVLVDFWASWCRPCRMQMPALRMVKEELASEDIVFVSVSIDTEKQNNDWLAASKDEKLTKDKHNYRLDKGPKNELLKLYGFSYVPRYLLYDRNGELVSDNFIAPNDPKFKGELLKYVRK